jgi:hypothetical protein
VPLRCRFLGRRHDDGAACAGRRRRSAQARNRGRCGPRVRQSLWGFAAGNWVGGDSLRRASCPDRRALRCGSRSLCSLIGLGWCLCALRIRPIGRYRASEIEAADWPTRLIDDNANAAAMLGHDVSILLTTDVGRGGPALRRDGSEPRAKTSMTSMRLPQQGHARG